MRLAAVAVLDQGAAFIDGLTDEAYTAGAETVGGSTIGQHVRHALDHFVALLDAYESEGSSSVPVAYDRRVRGTDLETNRASALDKISAVRTQLGALDDVQLAWPVKIRVLPTADGPEVDLDSTLVRELAFVTHHAIHHFAMCKTCCREVGASCEETFGRAPSTVAFERS